ncbi:Hypothetical protein Cp262_2148 [Corynebacterium pseudotuberculosis]|nr:Hypothetical protein Cp262_2148 [Corynebacterium pseudotuberculosis]ATB61712.1 Hypothetical protein BFF96_0826 [Corynebacterium pseudotuberculosis]
MSPEKLDAPDKYRAAKLCGEFGRIVQRCYITPLTHSYAR